MRSRLGLALLLAAMLTALALLPSGPAQAHALLVSSSPGVDASLIDPPSEVHASFSESLDRSLSKLSVIDVSGDNVDDGELSFSDDDRKLMGVGIEGTLEPGFYVVVWETLSAVDGHFIKGSYPFTVLNADGSQPSGVKPEVGGISGGGKPTVDGVAGKLMVLLGLAGLAGTLAFLLLVVPGAAGQAPADWPQRVLDAARRHAVRVLRPALVLIAVGGVVELIAQARQLGGFGLLDDVIDTDWGERWVQRQIVLALVVVLLAAGFRLRPALRRIALAAALAGAFGYMLLLSLVSHAGAAEGSFWAEASDFVHLTAASLWIGMLAQLGLMLLWARREAPDSARTPLLAAHLQRFSVLAAISVIALLSTGVFNALTEIPTWAAMVDTPYGRSLFAKLVLVGLLLPVAGLNAVILRPRAVQYSIAGGKAALESLRLTLLRMVWVEAALAVAILAVVGVLTVYPPARAVEQSEAFVRGSVEGVLGFEATNQAGDLGVNISITPNTAGPNSYQVFLFPPAGQPLDEILQVRLRFKPPDPSLGPAEVIADEVNPNFFKASGAFFTIPGGWEVQVDIRRADVDDVSTFFRVDVAAAGGGAGGSRFDLPLATGAWDIVAGIAFFLGAAVFWLPAQQWPRIRVRVARWLRMSALTCGVIGLALVLGVHRHTGLTTDEARQGNPVEATQSSIARGRELYGQNCASCHGVTGRGDGPRAKELTIPPADFKQHVPYHSDKFFFDVITRGFGDIMPPFGDQISEEDRWNLLNFLRAEHSLESQTK